jgi:hypothetical protein
MLCFLLLPSPPVRSSYGAAIIVGGCGNRRCRGDDYGDDDNNDDMAEGKSAQRLGQGSRAAAVQSEGGDVWCEVWTRRVAVWSYEAGQGKGTAAGEPSRPGKLSIQREGVAAAAAKVTNRGLWMVAVERGMGVGVVAKGSRREVGVQEIGAARRHHGQSWAPDGTG